MRIIVVGTSGRIGKEVDKPLSGSHDIIRVGAHSGDVQCDYTSLNSIRDMFKKIGQFDSLISVIGGDSVFKPFAELGDDDFRYGFERKFLGQIRFLKLGEKLIRDNAIFCINKRLPEPIPESLQYCYRTIECYVRYLYKEYRTFTATGYSDKRC